MSKKKNKIILHKKNGKLREVRFIKGLSISFKGSNSIVEIFEPISFNKRFIFNRSKFRISGDNNHIIIKSSNRKINCLQIKGLKNNNKIFIGENFYQTGSCNIDFANLSNMELYIGNDCMFGQNVEFMLGDHHKIYDMNTNEQTNIPKTGINIGNRVWLARQVKIMKDAAISDDTIVSIGSIVTKKFTKSNILIGGTPAKILKELFNTEMGDCLVAGADSQSRIGEWHEPETHLIPNILKSTFSGGKTFEMYGDDYDTKDGTCVRDYINIEDLVQAHLLALEYLNNGGTTNYFNLGTNNGNTVKEVFNICEKITEKKIDVNMMPRREGDPASLVADNDKAKEILKWQPTKYIEDSIITAYKWEKELRGRLC